MRDYSVLFISREEEWSREIEAEIGKLADGTVEWVQVDALFDGLGALQERTFDVIVSDLFLNDSQGLATLKHLKQQSPTTPVIALCHAKDRDTGVSAIRKGAHDFFCYEEADATSLGRSIALALKKDDADSGKTGADRRVNARFPCRLAVSYHALESPFFSGQATSETVNISSKGLLFAVNEPLEPNQLLQVSVDWPARLENEVPLKLVAEGRVIRVIDGQAAVRIDKYEFRTRKVKAQPAAGAAVPGKSTSHPAEVAKGAAVSRPGTAAGTKI